MKSSVIKLEVFKVAAKAGDETLKAAFDLFKNTKFKNNSLVAMPKIDSSKISYKYQTLYPG